MDNPIQGASSRRSRRRGSFVLVVVMAAAWCAPAATAVSPGTPGPLAYTRMGSDDVERLYTLAPGGLPVIVPGTGGARGFRWSPDGKVLAFEIWDQGIFLVNPDGSGRRPLFAPNEGEKFGAPVWSPDGQRLAFAVLTPGDPFHHIEVASTLDGERQVLDIPVEGVWDWAPDGHLLGYADEHWASGGGGYEDLIDVSPTGEAVSLTTTPNEAEGVPRISPDGRRIVFLTGTFESGIRYRVDVMDRDGSHRRTLVDLGTQLTWPAWSPDGREVVVAETAEAPGRTPRAIDVETGAIRRLTDTWGVGDGIDWAPATTPQPIAIAGIRSLALADPSVGATTTLSSPTLWPYRDGYRDTITITQTLREPGYGTVDLYTPAGKLAKRTTFKLMTYRNVYRWNGRWASGAIAAAGRYRLVSTVRDLAGNTIRTTYYVRLYHGRP